MAQNLHQENGISKTCPIALADWGAGAEPLRFRARREGHFFDPVEDDGAVENAPLAVAFHKPVEIAALHVPLLHLSVGAGLALEG